MQEFSFKYKRAQKHDLPAEAVNLIDAAYAASDDAYAPYSGFKVGAAVLLANGKVLTGHNFENASYPAGVCAERGVLSGINPLDKNQLIKSIAVNYQTGGGPGAPLSPCGICRQTILETQLAQGSPISIYMACPGNDVVVIDDATHLLPFYFSSNDLNNVD